MKSSPGFIDPPSIPESLPDTLPLLPLEDIVVFPNVVVPMIVNEGTLVELIDGTISDRQLVVLAYPSEGSYDADEDINGYLPVGTLGQVIKILRMEDNSIRLLIQGLTRVQIKKVLIEKELSFCRVREIASRFRAGVQLEALKRSLLLLFREMVALSPNLTDDLCEAAGKIDSAGELADFVISNIDLPLHEKRQLLAAFEQNERAQLVINLLIRERNLLELGKQIQSKVKNELDKDQREYYLREQIKVIQRELGEDDQQRLELDELALAVQESGMSEEAREMAERELSRLRRMSPAASEYHVSRTYLDWLINLPWAVSSPDSLDIDQARRILDQDHYDLEEVKERIIEYLAVRQLKQDTKGPILCFVGPPGVGKTSLGKSIARSLNRKFCRISLGGIRDEAEIRGHRRTYIGSMPGRLIQMLRRAGTNNPVIMLDEIDKTGTDFRSDPSSALLEVLDPAQNSAFSDHYLEVNFDLSSVLFIATANMIHQIPVPLHDRLETIEIPGYTESEKLQIARRHILPRQTEENGLKPSQLSLPDETIAEIITHYTRESGVRALEREIAGIARKTALRVLRGAPHPEVFPVDLDSYLGPRKFVPETAGRQPEVGVATGLGWTSVGGELLFVEVLRMEGNKQLELTGQLGEVMKESARAALSYLKANCSRLQIPSELFSQCDLHLHVPSGATPKDGPSAGAALATALTSLFSGRPVRHDVAMTGEITLRGKILPVGGIKEKILAAHRAKIKLVILPAENEKDLVDIPEEVCSQINFLLVRHIDEVLEAALLPAK